MNVSNMRRALVLSPSALLFHNRALAQECLVRVGEYSGRVKAEWLIHTREMKLLEDFSFKGPDCRVWAVPKGAIVDGASIPRAFWSIIGGPFDGRYRDASVVHDYYCKIRTAPSDKVHEMFYHAMLANGVESTNAKVMYYAVHWFGPSWQILRSVTVNQEPVKFVEVKTLNELGGRIDLVRQIAGRAGQPSPDSASPFTRRPLNETPATGWLRFQDGTVLDKGGEFGSPDAFKRSGERYSRVYTAQSGETFRIESEGPKNSEPSAAEVFRIQLWVKSVDPAVERLQLTRPNQVPRVQ